MSQILGIITFPRTIVPELDAPILAKGVAVVVCTCERRDSLKRFLESLAAQDNRPNQLIIVDASRTDDTEQMLRNYPAAETLGDQFLYFRVSGSLKGLTRQRNFALRWATTDLVAFFDDDIVLLPHCLQQLEQAHRFSDDQVIGVGALVQNETKRPTLLWHLRLLLRIVPNLNPGAYCRSGMSLPWSFLGPTEEFAEGDWLPGCAMTWKTADAREVGFNELYSGYSNGEDLEFSLRMSSRGRLVLTGRARVLHLKEDSGRPSAYELGYLSIHNAYDIHRRCLPSRTWRDAVWFVYAYGLDTLMVLAKLVFPRGTHERWQYAKGRLRFFSQLLRRQEQGSEQF